MHHFSTGMGSIGFGAQKGSIGFGNLRNLCVKRQLPLSFYPWLCRGEEAWFCIGLNVREKPDQSIFGFLGRE
jgi:hypothetical protein